MVEFIIVAITFLWGFAGSFVYITNPEYRQLNARSLRGLIILSLCGGPVVWIVLVIFGIPCLVLEKIVHIVDNKLSRSK